MPQQLSGKPKLLSLRSPRLLSRKNLKDLYQITKAQPDAVKFARSDEAKDKGVAFQHGETNSQCYFDYSLNKSTHESRQIYYIQNHDETLGRGVDGRARVTRYGLVPDDEDQTMQLVRVSLVVKTVNNALSDTYPGEVECVKIARNHHENDSLKNFYQTPIKRADYKTHSIQPLLPKFTLDSLLQREAFADISANKLLTVCKAMLHSLNGLHTIGVVHYDAHSGNVLLSANMKHVQVMDYGRHHKLGEVEAGRTHRPIFDLYETKNRQGFCLSFYMKNMVAQWLKAHKKSHPDYKKVKKFQGVLRKFVKENGLDSLLKHKNPGEILIKNIDDLLPDATQVEVSQYDHSILHVIEKKLNSLQLDLIFIDDEKAKENIQQAIKEYRNLITLLHESKIEISLSPEHCQKIDKIIELMDSFELFDHVPMEGNSSYYNELVDSLQRANNSTHQQSSFGQVGATLGQPIQSAMSAETVNTVVANKPIEVTPNLSGFPINNIEPKSFDDDNDSQADSSVLSSSNFST